jgi:predicted enzyme related to lactoylglutathione lyase
MFSYKKSFSSFSVNDISKAKEFYINILDLEVIVQPEGLSITFADGGNVFLYEKPNHTPASFTVLNFNVENIEETVDSLIAKGIQFEQYGGDIPTDSKGIFRGQGPLIAWFKDPAGNILSVLQEK